MWITNITWICLVCISTCGHGWTDTTIRKFKDGFMFGAVTSAYQIEGGWDSDGKGVNIWDKHLHLHSNVTADRTNGDVSSDSYQQYKRDVQLLRELGVDFYRFSVSWSRILPTGLSNVLNEKGLEYYDNLLDELIKYNIEPMVTLYHFDLPQTLQDLGGWANPLIGEWFENYARVVFDRYASKVKYWITVNQPNQCMETYNIDGLPPGVNSKGIGDYLCIKNILVAHAKVYRLYEREYKQKYEGSVGISISLNWFDPINNQTENVEAAEEARQFFFGVYMHPIWSPSGDFPTVVKEIVAVKSKHQGFRSSRLPTFNIDEIKLLKGSADFLGMNHYTTSLVERPKLGKSASEHFVDANVIIRTGKQWKSSKSPWLKSAPYGLYKACLYVNQQYNYPKIIITENGWSTHIGLSDDSRIEYLKEYLSALLLALEDGTDVIGYAVWSLMDNFEWLAGFSERFGLYQVDFNNSERTRTPRHSAFFYKQLIETKLVDYNWQYQDGYRMEISDRRLKKRLQEL